MDGMIFMAAALAAGAALLCGYWLGRAHGAAARRAAGNAAGRIFTGRAGRPMPGGAAGNAAGPDGAAGNAAGPDGAAFGGQAPAGRQPGGAGAAGRAPETEQRYETLLANIDAYDGTPRGQRPL